MPSHHAIATPFNVHWRIALSRHQRVVLSVAAVWLLAFGINIALFLLTQSGVETPQQVSTSHGIFTKPLADHYIQLVSALIDEVRKLFV